MSVIVVLLSALFPASAQNYTTDAILKRTTGKIATLECSGIARTKKEAIEMAKKSVIYTYLYNGIDGLNDNKPLFGRGGPVCRTVARDDPLCQLHP